MRERERERERAIFVPSEQKLLLFFKKSLFFILLLYNMTNLKTIHLIIK